MHVTGIFWSCSHVSMPLLCFFALSITNPRKSSSSLTYLVRASNWLPTLTQACPVSYFLLIFINRWVWDFNVRLLPQLVPMLLCCDLIRSENAKVLFYQDPGTRPGDSTCVKSTLYFYKCQPHNTQLCSRRLCLLCVLLLPLHLQIPVCERIDW